MFYIVPNILRDAINAKLDEQFALVPDAEKDRQVLYDKLVHYFNENGVIPDFSLVRRSNREQTGMTMAERMARAHDREEAAQRGEPDPWSEAGDDFERFRAERIACFVEALQVMRKPTDAMTTAAFFREMDDIGEWRAMIEAAIEEHAATAIGNRRA